MAEQQKNDAKLAHEKSILEQLKQDSMNAEKQKHSILKSLEKKVSTLRKTGSRNIIIPFFFSFHLFIFISVVFHFSGEVAFECIESNRAE